MSLLFIRVPCKKSPSGYCPVKSVNVPYRHDPCEYSGKCPYYDKDEEEDLDSADTEWIPVSESLPLLGVNVLVTRRMDNGVRYVRIASYQGDCWMDNTDEYMKPNPHPVIAWKSMPMAYCGEE